MRPKEYSMLNPNPASTRDNIPSSIPSNYLDIINYATFGIIKLSEPQ